MAAPRTRPRPGLMTAGTLAARLGEVGRSLVVVDMRRHRDDRAPGIPGAVWVDLHDGFAQRRPGRNLSYDLPSAAELAGSLSRLGVSPHTEVVFADDMLNRWATRAYWVLAFYRHPGRTWVLDGGLEAWRAGGHPRGERFATPTPAAYPAATASDDSILARAAELRAGITDGSLLACDVREREEYTGAKALSLRGGRIPGAAFVPFEECLAEDSTFLPNKELRTILAPFAVPGRVPVTYCQGGIRASLTWFCLHELLGRPARLYAASWEEWGQRFDLPAEAG